jgi:hypothetical protein
MSGISENRCPALEDFDASHGAVITTALRAYADHMRETAAECEQAAKAPETPPALTPDGRAITLNPTPAGLTHMARAFRESADAADRAREGYETLLDVLLGED